MDYKFTDLPKATNYLGFESGVSCFYPNYIDSVFLRNNFTCVEQKFFKARGYQHTSKGDTPTYYDPRCRPWYKI